MKKGYFIVFFLVVLALDVGGFGLSRLQENRFDFTPGFEMDFGYYIEGAEGKDVEVFLSGDLKDYSKIGRIIGDIDERRYFTVHMKLPDKLEPGMHALGVGVRELGSVNSQGTAINAVVEVIIPIKIFVPYEGKHIGVEFITSNGNIDEVVEFLLRIENLGDMNINSLHSEVMIYDFNDNLIEELVSDDVSLSAFEKKELKVALDLEGYKQGDYLAKAIVYYDENVKEVNSSFKVGSYLVEIISATDILIADKLNKFDIDIESGWNGIINNVYAVVSIFGSEIKTASMNLNAFENQTLSTYVDAGNISIGEHPVNITLYYGDSTTFEQRLVIVKEQEKSLYEALNQFILPAAILILIFLLVFDIVFLRRIKRKRLYKRKR